MADTAAEAPEKIETQGFFEEQPRSSSLLDLTGQLGYKIPSSSDMLDERERGLLDERAKSSESTRGIIEQGRGAARRQGEEIQTLTREQAGQRRQADPGELALGAPPRGQARTFLDAGPGASPLSQMFMLMLGVGQLGMQIGGVRGSSLAATAAIKGMAEGWAAGDNERIANEFAAWKTSSNKLIAEHKAAVEKYQRMVEDQKLTFEQKRAAWAVEGKDLEWASATEALNRGDIDAALKEVNNSRARHAAAEEKKREFDLRLEEMKRWHDMMSANQTLNREERAREADQRLQLAVRKFSASTTDKGGPDFTPEALEMYANVVANGGAQPALGWGKASTEARIKIANRAAEIRKQRGDEPGSLLLAQQSQRANQAELTKIQSQRGPMLAFAKTAERNLDLALQLSEKVDREQYPAFNRWLMSGELRWAGDPSVAAFAAATRVAINETAKVTNSATGGGVSTDTARREIEDMLSTALNPEQFRTVAGVLRTDMRNRIKGYDEQLGAVKGAISGGGAAPTKREALAPDGTPGLLPADTDLSKYPGYRWK